MIGTANELQKKNELQNILDKYRRNVEGVGSVEKLKAQYPGGYAKLRADIKNAGNAYVASAVSNIRAYIPDSEVQKTWGDKCKELTNAINNYSSDEVQKIVSNFISELMSKYHEKIVICPEEDDTLSA